MQAETFVILFRILCDKAGGEPDSYGKQRANGAVPEIYVHEPRARFGIAARLFF